MTKCEHCNAPKKSGDACPFCGVPYSLPPMVALPGNENIMSHEVGTAFNGWGDTACLLDFDTRVIHEYAIDVPFYQSEEQHFEDRLYDMRSTVSDFGEAVGTMFKPFFDVVSSMFP